MACGVLPVVKPAGPSSAAVVGRLRRLTGETRVGHSGTLDPAAAGLLVAALGRATRLLPYLPGEKSYRAEILLGRETDTLDLAGRVTAERPVPRLSATDWEVLLGAFRGAQLQVPPAFSALRLDGERAYRLARRGEAADLPARAVHIHALDLLDWTPPTATLSVVCSSGTYIRSLARDLGARLGCGAVLAALERTACNGFSLDDAVTLEAVAAGAWRDRLVPAERAVAGWPALLVTGAAERDVRRGRPLAAVEGVEDGWRARVLDGEDRLLAMARAEGGVWRMELVWRPEGGEPCA